MKKTFKSYLGTVLMFVFLIVLVLIGCSKKRTIALTPSDLGPAGTDTVTQTSTPVQTPTITPTRTPVSYPAGWIDDCEDGANAGTGNVCDFNGDNPAKNVGGYWITFDDDDWSNPYTGAGVSGSTNPDNTTYSNCGTSYVWPMSKTWSDRFGLGLSSKFTMSAPGYPSSPYGGAYCARMTGYVTDNTSATKPPSETGPPKGGTGFQYGFIGMGVQLTSTAGSPNCVHVDISGFTGLQFWAKSTSNGGNGASFEVKLPYTPTTNCDDPIHGTLDKFDDYAYVFSATSTWQKFTIPWTSFVQAGWGTAVLQNTVLQNASAIQWQSNGQTAYFLYPAQVDLEVDDVQLYH
jgi:hypothetical protein